MFAAPIWSSPFRPFYLMGAIYGPLAMLAGIAHFAGWIRLPVPDHAIGIWHGHELVFGFSGAIILGIVLTALPSWAKVPEMRPPVLALLAGLWLLGRVAFWLAPSLPPAAVAVADCAVWAAAAAAVAPGLFAAREKVYLAVLPIFVGVLAGNALFHLALGAGDPGAASYGLRAGIYAIVLLYVLKGGFLTPIFTGNRLRETNRGDVDFNPALEWTAIVAALLFILTDLFGLAPAARAGAALSCAAVHALRLARWQGWKVADTPLLWAMHLGYAWMVASMALRGLEDLGLAAPGTWVHAFTAGALGMMMLGLTSRVTLRHTGRPLEVPGVIVAAFWMMMFAAVLRVGTALLGGSLPWLVVAALLWSVAFLVYLVVWGRVLVSPSLPRDQPGTEPIRPTLI